MKCNTFTFEMPAEIAARVKALRTGEDFPMHSYRALGQVIAKEFPDYTREHLGTPNEDEGGNQLYGIELCQHAAETLGEPDAEWK